MASRLIALVVAVSLLAGIVQLPIAAVPATTPVGTAEHGHRHCCPKLEVNQVVSVIPALPGPPCGPNHSCCVVRAPAKLPSLPPGSNGQADRQPVRAMKVSLFVPDKTSATPEAESLPTLARPDRSTVLRI